MTDESCLEQNIGRRRLFWTTQPLACGEYTLCGNECQIPGLEYVDVDDPHSSHGGTTLRTIKTTNWLESLILNILNTRARTDLPCPSPGSVYGHWSESYRKDGLYIGATLWNAAARSYVRVADAVKAIGTAVKADVSKLIALNLADSVDVEVTYRGDNAVDVLIKVTKLTHQYVLNLSGSFRSGTWAWAAGR